MKVQVGEYCCLIDDVELGCNPLGHHIPDDAIDFNISCKYQNDKYIALKCDYDECCDFKKKVTTHDLIEYPELFEEEED